MNNVEVFELAFYENVIGKSPNLRAYKYKTTTLQKAILGQPLGAYEKEFWRAVLAEIKGLNRDARGVPDVIPASIPGEATGYGGIVPDGVAWGGINGVHANFMIRDRPDGVPNPWKARINAVLTDAGKSWWCQLAPDERMKIRTVLDEMDGVAAATVMKSTTLKKNAGADADADACVFLVQSDFGVKLHVTPQEKYGIGFAVWFCRDHIA